jgi:hypothetical protein
MCFLWNPYWSHRSIKNSASTFCAPDAPYCTMWPTVPTKCKNTIFDARVGLVWIPQMARLETLCQTCVFASGVVSVTLCILMPPEHETLTHYFWCSGGTSIYSTKKCTGTRSAKLVFLHPVGAIGDIVHSVVSGAWNINALFFIIVWFR